MEEHTVLVLLPVGGNLTQRQDHRRRWGGGAGRVGQGVGAEGMGEDRGPARQQQPRGVGEEGRGRRAVAVESTLDRLESVCTIAPGTREVFIPLLRRWRGEGGHHKARGVPGSHDFGFDDPAPRMVPRGRSIGAGLIDATAGGGLLALGMGASRLLPPPLAGGLHEGTRLAEKHGMPCEAEDAVHPAPLGEHLQHCGCSAMTITSHEDVGVRPVAPERGEEADQEHGIFQARGPLPRPEARCHSGLGSPCKNAQREIDLLSLFF